jgi:F-box/leucine-rich repeat protein 5
LQQVKCGQETSHGWVRLAEQLKKAIVDFTVDYIPHMNEEEEIYLPLLMKYFTEDELRDLTVKVMELHTLSNRKSRACSIFSLPPEILLRIFSFLSPKDLCRMSQTHSFFTQLCYDETLWRSIHPIHWANGHWQFFPAINIDKLCHTMLLSNDRSNTALPYRGSNTFDTNELLEKETRIIQGLINHLLPKIGHAVDVIDLSYSTALTSSMASDILMFCMNISHLNLSYADVSDEAFKCFLHQKRSRLQYVNLTGCQLITDVTLYMISWTCSPSLCCSCNDVNSSSLDDNFPRWTTCAADDVSALKCLILSGCHLITDDGLKYVKHPVMVTSYLY